MARLFAVKSTAIALACTALTPLASAHYVQPDPMGLHAGVNPYAYVDGNPLQWIDPNGLEPRLPGTPVLVCLYGQGNGSFSCIDQTTGKTVVEGSCYSGTGAGRDNPAMNGVPSQGPTPRGWWDIANGQTTRLGSPSFRLAPDPGNSVYQTLRQPNSFLIHADNARHDASEGCTICERRIRDVIDRYPGSRLVVQ
jgi:hypothetical protein